MDVSGFMGGNWLTHLDLPAPSQVWTIREVTQQQVDVDKKICVRFDQHQKLLGLNKTNLRVIAVGYGTDSNVWIGRPLELYRDKTHFQGQLRDCIRVRIPQQPQPSPAPAPAPQPAPAPAPWTQQQ